MIEENLKGWPAGIIKTKPRERMLLVLKNAERPLSAMEIWAEMQKNNPPSSLSTVYRSLEQFIEKGIVTKLTIMNHELAVYELTRSQHKHYAICWGCHRMFPMEYCPVEHSLPEIIGDGFQVRTHNLEVYGYCRECSHL